MLPSNSHFLAWGAHAGVPAVAARLIYAFGACMPPLKQTHTWRDPRHHQNRCQSQSHQIQTRCHLSRLRSCQSCSRCPTPPRWSPPPRARHHRHRWKQQPRNETAKHKQHVSHGVSKLGELGGNRKHCTRWDTRRREGPR